MAEGGIPPGAGEKQACAEPLPREVSGAVPRGTLTHCHTHPGLRARSCQFAAPPAGSPREPRPGGRSLIGQVRTLGVQRDESHGRQRSAGGRVGAPGSGAGGYRGWGSFPRGLPGCCRGAAEEGLRRVLLAFLGINLVPLSSYKSRNLRKTEK